MIYQDISINQGSDYINTLNLVATDGTPVFIENYQFSGQIRLSYYSANASANLNLYIVDQINGIVGFTLDAANTANLLPGNYVYTVTMKDTNNVTSQILGGLVNIIPQANWGNSSPVLPYE